MQFGLYVTQPNVTVGSREIAQSIERAREPLPAGAVDLQMSLGADVLGEADRCGFDIVLFAERHLGPDLVAWLAAAAMGSRFQRLRSMVAVHPGLWHPAMVAKLSASLDRMCPGRMALNIVTGWNEAEFAMFGGEVLLGDDSRRYARAQEFVTVLRGLWTQAPFSYEGAYYQLRDADLQLRPATASTPEIFTAARSSPGLDMVSESADWWFVDFPKVAADEREVMAAMTRAMADMDARAQRFGRKVRYAFNPFVAFGADVDAAMSETVRRLAEFDPDSDGRKIRSRIAPALKAGCIGRPQDVRDQMARYRDMGIELLLLKFPPTLADVRLMRDEIIAPLRAAWGDAPAMALT